MTNWEGNIYNRKKDFENWLASVDWEELRAWGAKRTPQDYMAEYGYATTDEDIMGLRNSKPIVAKVRIPQTKPGRGR